MTDLRKSHKMAAHFRLYSAPNGGTTRWGVSLEKRLACADDRLWDRVKPGPEKAGLWYTGSWTVVLATPWRRLDIHLIRAVPERVKRHMEGLSRVRR